MAAYYPTESTELNIARGLVKGTSQVHKFGAVDNISNGSTGSVWDIKDTEYPWAIWDASGATTITIDLADAGDVNPDSHIHVYGLDENYDLVSDTVDLLAQTGNTSTVTFTRVFRAYHSNHVTNAHNIGNIDIKNGTTIVARITAGFSQTMMSVYTIPAGYTGYLSQGIASCGVGAHATMHMFVRFETQENFRVGHSFELQSVYDYNFTIPQAIPGRCDIDVRYVMKAGNNLRITTAFDLILIKNGLN